MHPVQLQVSTVVDAVEASLRHQILNLDIPGGSAVRETDVAKAFEVGRPTAKAAIERLVSAGLLRRESHRSAVVPALLADDVADLYLTRSVVEAELCRHLAMEGRLPPKAQAAIEAMRILPADSNPDAFVEPDLAFHTVLAEYSPCRRLIRIHAALMQEIHLCMAQLQAYHLLSPKVIISEHQAIADAIQSGDAAATVSNVQQHVANACDALVGFLRSQERTQMRG